MPAEAPADEDALHRLELQFREARAELEAVKEQLKEEKPWYRQMSGIVSVAAFVLSILSGLYSCQRDIDQERQQARVSLNTLSQRLLALPKENFELMQKYKGDGSALSTLSPLLNSENITLVNSMKELVAHFPDLVTDNDKFVLASALVNSARVPEAIAIYGDLAQTASDPKRRRRRFAQPRPLFPRQRPPRHRTASVRKRHRPVRRQVPVRGSDDEGLINRYTYLTWAKSELWLRNCDEAQGALGKAAALAAGMPMQPGDLMLQVAAEIERDIHLCRSGQPVPQAPLPMP